MIRDRREWHWALTWRGVVYRRWMDTGPRYVGGDGASPRFGDWEEWPGEALTEEERKWIEETPMPRLRETPVIFLSAMWRRFHADDMHLYLEWRSYRMGRRGDGPEEPRPGKPCPSVPWFVAKEADVVCEYMARTYRRENPPSDLEDTDGNDPLGRVPGMHGRPPSFNDCGVIE